MSFLSRRTSRPDQRGGRADAGRRSGSEYDDYDYGPDEYQPDDDNWSPDEYFSPEGIKGRWAAGARPGNPADARGADRGRRSADGYGREAYPPQDGYAPDNYGGGEYGGDEYGPAEYGPAEYGTGGYELPDGSDDRGERSGGGRRRRDRGERVDRGDRGGVKADRGERKRRLGRRDRGDDIWPDDGVSDEDYWASVTADRPMTSAGSLGDGEPRNVVNHRQMARPARAGRAGGGPNGQSGPGGPGGPGGSGRLGPAPGQAGYVGAPVGAGGANSGPMARPGTGPMARPGTGPSPARSGTGPDGYGPDGYGADGYGPDGYGADGYGADGYGPGGTRSSTGPQAARPGQGTGPVPVRHGTGPHPARHATGPHPARPAAGLAQPGHTQSGLTQPTVAQPALAHPSAAHSSAAQAGAAQAAPAQPSFSPNPGRGPARQPDHGDWGERTERIDRIAPGYPDPRPNGRSQAPAAASIWGGDDAPERSSRNPRHSRRRPGDDDPLTSKAFSRDELQNTDGRSYRVASRRAQVSPDRYESALTEQTQTFTMNGQHGADPQAATARYPVRGGQQSAAQSGSHSGPQPGLRPGGQPAQNSGRQAGGGHQQQQQSRQSRNGSDPYGRGYPYPSGQAYPSRSATSDQDDNRYGRGGRPNGYDQGPNGHNGANGHNGGGYGYSDNARRNGSGRDGYGNARY